MTCSSGRLPTAPSLCILGWVKCREHISLLVILCTIVYVTNKAHLSLIIIIIIRFLRGERRLNHSLPPSIPSWDLSLALRALQPGPFEPLQTVDLKFLSMKTLFLLALALSREQGTCMHFRSTIHALSLCRLTSR